MPLKWPGYITQAPAAFAGIVSRVNYLLAVAKALTNIRGDSAIKATLSEGNLLLTLQGELGGGSVEEGPVAFDVTLTSISATQLTASVWPGTVNNLLPSNYSSIATINKTGTYYITVNVTAASNLVTGVSLAAPTSAPAVMPIAKNALPTSAAILIAIVVDGVLFQVRNGNITLAPREVFRIEKSPLVAGTLPYDSYWTWEVAP